MDADEFVESFTERVFRSAINVTISGLEVPSGRRPASDRLKASAWFATLSDDDREMVRWVVAATAHAATFGALAVIDGARPTGPYRYELIAVGMDGERSVVNPESGEDLHDTFQGIVMEPDGRLRTGAAPDL